ncbi:helix-turn-helix domain-containing protein [Methylotenera versatilis]|uniref:helix-turn-helix domain-containing protein n=1 Tax=Methylotenera versatilis TaxID=1055487 RepID=UPI000648C7E0|nr:RodZ domain-containing protein [Methylotenera versatilis]
MARKNTDNVDVKQAPEQANVSENLASSTADANQAEYLAYSRSRCGGALRIAREKQGLSLNDVTSRLKISNKQIEAIEADNFTALPESTIVKGFIRNYAKLLKLDAGPLLDAYNVLVPSKEPLAFTIKPSSTMKVGGYKKPKTGRYIVFSVLLALALATWLFYQHYIEKPSPTAPIAGTEKLEPLPEQALPAVERMEQSTEIALPPATVDSLNAPQSTNSPDSLNAPQAALTPNSSATANAQLMLNPNAASASTPVVDQRGTRLELAASQETWVSVVDAKGKQVYSKIIFAGGRETVEAKTPLELVIGNAIGTTLMVNGKSVDLAPHTRVNVARLKLE